VKVLVDTPVWSLNLRRRPQDLTAADFKLKKTLDELVDEDRVLIIGPIRQELLSGLRDQAQFNRLLRLLEPFQDTTITTSDYENAARMSNLCSSRGIANSSVDMLICAVAVASAAPILTADGDFLRYSKVLPIKLF
jgi:predicted nucleic acid-binding protein